MTAQTIDISPADHQRFNDDLALAASSRFPTIPDPHNTDINQLFFDYTGLPRTLVRLGKQSIKFISVCFVGNAEFRQVMQCSKV